VTATEIIREIEALPPQQQAEVVRFAWQLGIRRKLSPSELGDLGTRLASTDDPIDAAVIREEIVQGFYGSEPNA
jgi:hypothetical protein